MLIESNQTKSLKKKLVKSQIIKFIENTLNN